MSNSETPAADPAAPIKPETERGAYPSALLAALLLIVIGGMTIFAVWQRRQRRETGGSEAVKQQLPADWISEFTLTERNGAEVGSADLLGNVWVTNFFYSSCPGSCRQQSLVVMGLEREFRQQDVKFVSITCDPEIDDPARLRDYAHGFEAPDDWWFLTGDLLYIRRIGAEFFQLAVSKAGHQDRLAVVDKWGTVRGRFNWHDELELNKLRRMVNELVLEQQDPNAEEPAPASDAADGGSPNDTVTSDGEVIPYVEPDDSDGALQGATRGSEGQLKDD